MFGTQNNQQKIVGIKQFRHLVDSFIFEQVSDTDQESISFKDSGINHGKFNDLLVKVLQKVRELGNGVHVFGFLIQVYTYVTSRLRVLMVLMSVVLELINDFFDFLKKLIIRNLFWGRGSLFRYSFLVVATIIGIITLLSTEYRSAWIQKGIGVAGRPIIASNIASSTQSDLLVQNSTTRTLQPEDRARQEVDIYTVKSGDTMESIAKFYSLQTETIMWANNLSLATQISSGDKLKIPPSDGVLVNVQDGESLDSLARKYSSTTQLIADANLLDPPFNLQSGKELFIPNGRPPVPLPSQYTFSGVISSAPAPWWTATEIDPEVGRFLSWPVKNGVGIITQCPSAWHNAVDIADSSMPDLVAAADGVVNFAGCHSGSCPPAGVMIGGSGVAWGVEVDHGNGYTTLYAHMNAIYVTKGQRVEKGQPLGQMGMSGTATGIHIHFELWKGAKWARVDPAAYLDTGVCGY